MRTKRQGLGIGATFSAAALAALAVILLAPATARAQWTTPDTNGNVNTASGVNNVGVGVANPAEKLTVAGSIAATGSSAIAGSQFIITNNDTTGPWMGVHTDRFGNSTTNYAAPRLSMQAAGVFFQTSPATAVGAARTWTTRMAINGSNGNVGVGTSTPGALLDVRGSIALDGTVPAAHAATNYSSLWLKNNVAFISEVATGYSVLTLGTNYQRSAGGWTNVDTAVPAWSLSFGAGTGYDQFELNHSPSGTYTRSTFMVVNSSGNVGIGNSTPGSKLFVGSGTPSVTTLPGLNVAMGSTLGSYVAASNGVVNTFIGSDVSTYGIVGTLSNHPLGLRANNTLAVTVMPNGNVGIGTSTPGAKVSVTTTAVNDGLVLNGSNNNWATLVANLGAGAYNGISRSADRGIVYGGASPGSAGGGFIIAPWMSATSGIRLDASGNVGIGTATPGATLDVYGTINASGAITGGTINAKYQDVAEWVPSTQKLAAGTVVVLDTGKTNHVLASTKSYDTGVAGVVSDSPGVILGVGGDDKVKVATTGRVKVRADATRGAIKVGDLLVTSDVEGVAMKSVEVDLGGVKLHRPGTIIGKALEPLDKGTGEILVLLSLQ